MFLDSDLEILGVNWQELARYAYMMATPSECKQFKISHLLPTRRFRYGPTPGLSSADVKSRTVGADSQWLFPNCEPSKLEMRSLIAVALMVGIRASFGIHHYKYNRKLYKQVADVPWGHKPLAQ